MARHVGCGGVMSRALGRLILAALLISAIAMVIPLDAIGAEKHGKATFAYMEWSSSFEGGSKPPGVPTRPRHSASADPGVISYIPFCALGGRSVCSQPDLTCPDPNHRQRYQVVVDGVRTSRTICFNDNDKEPGQASPVTPGRVLREVRRYGWQAPDLHVQPGDGWTLVNLATNAYTTLAQPEVKSFTLLGHAVVVAAGPRSYSWSWGDGTSTVTSTPGHRVIGQSDGRVDLAGCVAHVYARRGTGLVVSVAAVYAGRYRIDGGPWQQLPGTLTVPGQHVRLDVETATPVLVPGG